MNRQSISDIRRRLSPDKHNLSTIHGCYVDEKGQIISRFDTSLDLLPQQESEKYLLILRRILTGMPGKNLLDIAFPMEQVESGEQHRLLMALTNTALKVEQSIDRFFEKVIAGVELEDKYLILLAHDSYDVPFRAKDGMKLEDGSDTMFQYILCAICPVKQTRPALSYCTDDQSFHDRDLDWVVSAPELGFMFPSYEDGCANIYNAQLFTRDAADAREAFVSELFGGRTPMPATEQKETFDSLLGDALGQECSLEVVQTVHEQMRELIDERKADKTLEAPTVSKREVKGMLEACGVSQEHVTAFEEQYDEAFGAVDLSAQNIVDAKKFELRTPDVMIRVNPERSELIRTRVIDGSRCILIRADEGVEVNGVNISIEDLGEDVD